MSSDDASSDAPNNIANNTAKNTLSIHDDWRAATQPETIMVASHRLRHGTWCRKRHRIVGVGDVIAAYSADLIDAHQRIRPPFLLDQWQRVATSLHWGPQWHATTYRLVPLDSYDDRPATSEGGDGASESLGDYHGRRVEYGGQSYVLVGPPVRIEPIQTASVQLELF